MRTKLLLPALLCAVFGYSQTIELELFAYGLSSPVEITHAGDERLFVVEQAGYIQIVDPEGAVNDTPFLDVSDLTDANGEQGLLGLAFHPDYEENGYFFINYTNLSGDTVIARYSVSDDDPEMADPDSGLELLTIDQPYANHNGGCLRFGPDGYLYVGMGDGGDGNDPQNRAQNLGTLLGKMLRLDVDTDGEEPYEIPDGNPFVGMEGEDEIWAYGMRNPWKFSFDRLTGDLWIADVGQNQYEEINMVAPTAAGLNYGWRCYEASHEHIMEGCSDTGTYTMPVAEYSHTGGRCSITGGYVYTGEMYPSLQGMYVFADLCSGEVGVLDNENNITWTATDTGGFTTFGEDVDGELYIASGGGNIYKIASTLNTSDFNKQTVSIYPNPATNEVFIELQNLPSASVKIFDLGGKLLVHQNITADNKRIDTAALQNGIYLLQVENDNVKHTKKLMINQ